MISSHSASETSSHTLAYAIILLAIYPSIQEKLREEALRVWPTLEDVHSSTYHRDFDKFVRYTLTNSPFFPSHLSFILRFLKD